MTSLDSEDGSRSAVVYPVVNAENTWRTRVGRFPGEGRWFGGRVLWGHDKPTEAEALDVARAWTERGEMPEGMTP